ncbi:DUF3558 family protein [Streptomyces triticirhizae]|uniref:DUF3558 family protein n=1 Tax=Streptomyces triticirhizae TaxID=2483353 RepID=UPI0018F52495|nr:DUF3558 family protein [Streptomyces triticirhizae]
MATGWRRRTVAACGLAATLLVAGCGGSDSGNNGGSGNGDGGASSAGGDASPAEETEPEPEEDAEAAGLDACELLTEQEVATAIGAEALHVTSRRVAPEVDGGRLAGCSYLNEDVPGIAGMTLNVVAGTDDEAFFMPFAEREGLYAVDELGERNLYVGYETGDGSVHFRELRIMEGDTGLHLRYTYHDNPGGMPALDEDSMVDAMTAIASSAIERLPDQVTIADGVPEGPCAEIDLALAAEALGGELTTAGSVVGEDGALNCEFGGVDAELTVLAVTDPARVASMGVPAAEVNVPDLGDGARVRVMPADAGAQGPLDATVNVGGTKVVVVSAVYAPEAGAMSEPAPEAVELVRHIAATVG